MLVVEYTIRDATEEDAEAISLCLRQVDQDEIEATTSRDPCVAVLDSMKHSQQCRVGLADGEYVCIYGCRKESLFDEEAVIWMLGTDLLEKHWIKFLRENRSEFQEITANTRVVFNWVDARNKITLRWLRWLGFRIEEAQPFGVLGYPFHFIWRET